MSTTNSSPTRPSRLPARILVAEDSVINRLLMSRLLAQLGYRAEAESVP